MDFTAIVFDYGNVLAGEPGNAWARDIPTIIGVDPQQYAGIIAEHNQAVHTGEITWAELWEKVLRRLDLLDKLPAVIACTEAYEESLNHLNQNVVNLAVQLKDVGYKIGVLSNTTRDGAERIHRKLADYPFDIIHCSSETGKVKPSPEAFYDVAAALDIDIRSMIFVDDSKRSLSTAESCGYEPVLFSDYQQLIDALVLLKIPVKS